MPASVGFPIPWIARFDTLVLCPWPVTALDVHIVANEPYEGPAQGNMGAAPAVLVDSTSSTFAPVAISTTDATSPAPDNCMTDLI